jgi:phosphatidylserine decarboxylase
MSIDRSGIPFIAGALVPAVGFALAKRPLLAAPLAALGGFFAFFFRDPERHAPDDPDAVLSPADGRVVWAAPAEPVSSPPGSWLQITIFLSPLDVHINRTPVPGRVTRVDYRAGSFLAAYKPESWENEQTEVWLEHEGQTVVFRQVVGVLARRIVCRVAPGMTLGAGQRVGLMKFGSRMDVFLPVTARLTVAVGEHVRGGETIIARLERAAGRGEGALR